jgi:CRISPR-associated DxTHG motif protein
MDGMGGQEPAGQEALSGGQVLLTFVGRQPRAATYTLHGQQVCEDHAGLALLQLLKLLGQQAPKTARVLATPETMPIGEKVTQRFRSKGCEAQCVGLPPAENLGDFLRVLANTVPRERAQLVLDLTHGFRHLPMLTYAGLLYLSAIRPDAEVSGCWYGLLEDNQARFLDLLPLVQLPEWLWALRLFWERNDATRFARLLRNELGSRAQPDDDLRTLAGEFGKFAHALAWHCPLDVAHAAGRLSQDPRRMKRALREAGLLAADELADRFTEILKQYQPACQVRKDQKLGVDKATLAIHTLLVDQAFERMDLPAAAGLLREWLVSWAWLMAGREGREGREGLDRAEREPAGRLLGALGAIKSDPDLPDPPPDKDRQDAVDLWQRCGEIRNALAHNGMRRQFVHELDAQKLKEKWQEFATSAKDRDQVDLRPGRQGTVLVSPLGKSPGVLAGALDCCDPSADRLLVVTSQELVDQGQVSQALGGRLTADRLTVLALQDARGGVAELQNLVKQSKAVVAGAERVRVNLTGGTTLIGLAVEQVALAAQRLEIPVRRFVLIEPEHPGERSRHAWVDPEEA